MSELPRRIALLSGAALAAGAGVYAALRSTVINIVEPTSGPWANQNTFGDQRNAPLPVTEGKVIEVLPKNNRMYGPPHVHSVNLSRSDEVPTDNADVYARITYGCGGIENSFDCDWLHGQQFSLVCNSIHIEAVTYRPVAALAYTASGASVFLGAMVSKGGVSKGGELSFTEQLVRLDAVGPPSASARYHFPDLARELTVHVHVNGGPANGNSDPSVATGVLIIFANEGGNNIALYDAQVCAGGAKIPIPGGANVVGIVNTNAAHTADVAAQFFLAL